MDVEKKLKKKGVRLYVHWANCVKGKCGEGYGGKCHVKGGELDYPLDGKCVNDFYQPVDNIDLSEIGAFETIKQASEAADIPF